MAKRGPKPEGCQPPYVARLSSPLPLSAQQRDFLRRRTAPFLDAVGLDRPIIHLLQEAYLQGVRDTLQATMEATDG